MGYPPSAGTTSLIGILFQVGSVGIWMGVEARASAPTQNFQSPPPERLSKNNYYPKFQLYTDRLLIHPQQQGPSLLHRNGGNITSRDRTQNAGPRETHAWQLTWHLPTSLYINWCNIWDKSSSHSKAPCPTATPAWGISPDRAPRNKKYHWLKLPTWNIKGQNYQHEAPTAKTTWLL